MKKAYPSIFLRVAIFFTALVWCTLANRAAFAQVFIPIDTGARLTADFVRGGVDVFDYLSREQREDVRSCRLQLDITDSLKASIEKASDTKAKRVVLPAGCYRTSSTINLPTNMSLVGASIHATRIVAKGNFPAISASGTYAKGLAGVSVENMSIICSGMNQPDAMGVKLVYVNRGNLQNLYFKGCRHALDLYDQWQTRIDNVTADGQGAQQNSVGVYMGPPTDRANMMPNNAVILSNSTMQNVAQYGYQLVFFAGSKFVNAEAMNGITGWKLCGEPLFPAEQACQFGHFDNILADTTSGPGIMVDQGSNRNPVTDVMFDHVWIGSSKKHGIYLAGVTNSQFDNVHVTRSDNGVYLYNSQNVKVSANIAYYNRQNDDSHAAVIDGGQDNTLWATNSHSDYPNGYNGIVEIGPTHGNSVWGGLADCRLALVTGISGSERQFAPDDQFCRYEIHGRQVRLSFRMGSFRQQLGAEPVGLGGLPFPVDALGRSVVGNALSRSMGEPDGTILVEAEQGKSSLGLYVQEDKVVRALTGRQLLKDTEISGALNYVKH